LVLDNESVSKAAMAEMHEIAAVYRNMLGDRIPTDKRFIDKLPLNFLTVGFIINALSEARVICLRRNALDTCLSNFRQLFALNFSYYNYHYDLADTARFYVAFDSLMKFWQLSFPDRFHQINYENLVDNPENSVREIMDYLALEWEPGCLNFHTSNEPVATASASQVRRPLYRDSVARWKKYAEFLQPAMEILDQAGIEYR
ncbi:MAG: sulfotransferase, partial [Planctomycetaceae bacterium]|nr:sulfotransferase [Planctomycetaceae bacterium]